ncbi:hypothetical protein RKE25_22885 (plasmid) [Dyella sp. BiH032]|uniref:DUF6998 domain-containing protein n=1 Tax=Dyella sp. BiH032 TaxID=3075430 RepID=UPI002892F441|nr:hypothetical protein [Dyella sp. BiH032]WNL48382.1 hypothetical protein RKE25_22885 [Dyella sp. BiH032]
MALTQMQQLQSLGEALAWLERELNWGVEAKALPHLCGRIGELYACVLTNGQMALQANQRGYDVVSAAGERVSVKTTTRSLPCQIPFNANTLSEVDRVVVVRINTEDMQVEQVYDELSSVARTAMAGREGGKLMLTVRGLASPPGEAKPLAVAREAFHNGSKVVELENGTIQVWSSGQLVEPTKPALREMAKGLGITLTNGSGNEYNTRTLGSHVLDALYERGDHVLPMAAPGPSTSFIG